MHELLSRERALDCAALLDRLVDDVRGFARDGLDDDVTGVLIGKD